MYADRYASPHRLNPVSIALAIAINGAVMGALVFSAPIVEKIAAHGPFILYPVKEPPPPEPIPTPEPRANADPIPERITVPRHVEVEVTRPDPGPLVIDIGPSTGTLTGTGTDPVTVDPPPPPLPPLIPAQTDPRYAAALQPPYPSAERRANREGNVVIKVLIGTDGRVKRVERVSATSDAFYEATRRQALGHWRFKPATRGGVPQESWITKSVRFVMSD
ncbi:outer membrane transport energization protein TonB [Hephaestia caeni]|uniref:Protein TonB n=1 Tax=Hephaestia caeni TaxID=645617 RepID=A0A397PFJ8_9SPHN|nr:energy transducer TonB [Hephaestia caeni]RIA44451.1 outer membrane transport energization protein TonB [Hephaestia caeni]